VKAWAQALLAAAERRVPGLELNAVNHAVREAAEDRYGQAVVYEVVLDGDAEAPQFAADTLAKLQEHLQAKRMNPEGQDGLLVWVWADDAAHLYSGPTFVEHLRRLIGPAALLPG